MRKERLIVLILAFLAFGIRVFPHTFLIPFVVREEGGILMLTQRILNHDFSYLSSFPPVSLFGVAIMHTLLPISLPTCAFIWNPLMSAFATIVFYYILKDVLKVSTPYLGTMLFVFLDSNIYRTTLFGSSSEGTGILILFIFIYTYFKVSKPRSLIFLVVLLWTHIIVFGFGFLVLAVDQVLINVEDINKQKKKIIMIGISVMILGSSFFYILPYRIAVFDMVMQFKLHTISNLYRILTTRMLPILYKTLLGTVILTLVSVYHFWVKRCWVSYMGMIMVGIIIVSTLLSSSHISPYRVLPYAGLIGVMSLSLIRVKHKTLVTVFLIGLMLTQVTVFGWKENNRIYDAVTEEELEIIEWIQENYPESVHFNILWDDVGQQLLLYEFPYSNPESMGYTQTKEEWEEYIEFKLKLILINAKTGGEFPDIDFINFVVYSDRFAERALFRLPEYEHLTYSRYSIYDMWENDPRWVLIYENEGGKVYGKKSFIS